MHFILTLDALVKSSKLSCSMVFHNSTKRSVSSWWFGYILGDLSRCYTSILLLPLIPLVKFYPMSFRQIFIHFHHVIPSWLTIQRFVAKCFPFFHLWWKKAKKLKPKPSRYTRMMYLSLNSTVEAQKRLNVISISHATLMKASFPKS